MDQRVPDTRQERLGDNHQEFGKYFVSRITRQAPYDDNHGQHSPLVVKVDVPSNEGIPQLACPSESRSVKIDSHTTLPWRFQLPSKTICLGLLALALSCWKVWRFRQRIPDHCELRPFQPQAERYNKTFVWLTTLDTAIYPSTHDTNSPCFAFGIPQVAATLNRMRQLEDSICQGLPKAIKQVRPGDCNGLTDLSTCLNNMVTLMHECGSRLQLTSDCLETAIISSLQAAYSQVKTDLVNLKAEVGSYLYALIRTESKEQGEEKKKLHRALQATSCKISSDLQQGKAHAVAVTSVGQSLRKLQESLSDLSTNLSASVSGGNCDDPDGSVVIGKLRTIFQVDLGVDPWEPGFMFIANENKNV